MKFLRVLVYPLEIYVKSVFLIFIFLSGKYAVGVFHMPAKKIGKETWLVTLMPDSIVFEVEKSYLHVHRIFFKK